MAPLVFRPWLFFLFILTFSWHYRIMWQRKAWGRGKEGNKEEGGGGQCSQKHKNKRTANWDFSTQAPSFQKVSVNHPSSPRTPSSGLAWTKWELPSQLLIRVPSVQSSHFPQGCLPLPLGASHPKYLLRRQKGIVNGACGWRVAGGPGLQLQSGLLLGECLTRFIFCCFYFVWIFVIVVTEHIKRWYVP